MDNVTLEVIGFVVIFLIAYDFWVYSKKGSIGTISVQMFEISKKYPMIPFIVGFIMGHIFWTQ